MPPLHSDPDPVSYALSAAMGHGGNKVIPNTHFRKDWQLRVKTWFNQPAKKLKRRNLRAAKAKAVFPRPVERLRPVVHAPTQKYNAKTRAGRGFSLDELKVRFTCPGRLGSFVGWRRITD